MLGAGHGITSRRGSMLGAGHGITSRRGSMLGAGHGITSRRGSMLGAGHGITSLTEDHKPQNTRAFGDKTYKTGGKDARSHKVIALPGSRG
eukprot:gene21189-23617_t